MIRYAAALDKFQKTGWCLTGASVWAGVVLSVATEGVGVTGRVTGGAAAVIPSSSSPSEIPGRRDPQDVSGTAWSRWRWITRPSVSRTVSFEPDRPTQLPRSHRVERSTPARPATYETRTCIPGRTVRSWALSSYFCFMFCCKVTIRSCKFGRMQSSRVRSWGPSSAPPACVW